MGIVFQQSFKNSISIYIGFFLGAVNALFLYIRFLQEDYYGLVTFLLSTANIMMPFIAFGVQHTIIRFFYQNTTTKQKDIFLTFVVFLPLLIGLTMGLVGIFFYEKITLALSVKNPLIKEYVFIIYWIAFLTAYFEVFYAWVRVHLQSVLGAILKEVFPRIIVTLLLILMAFGIISKSNFIYLLTIGYFIRTVLMLLYALKIHLPKWTFTLPENTKGILRYAVYILLAGAAGGFLLDIDKFMIPQKQIITQVAYYTVAVYIGSVIEIPGRAMAQITQPLVSKAIEQNDTAQIKALYQKSSINLLLVCGGVFLCVLTNIKDIYTLIGSAYSSAVDVVLLIALSKLFHMAIGVNGAIITNSKYYKILLPYAVLMSVSVIIGNYFLIDLLGIYGAALSTFLVVSIFNGIKIAYVYKKFSMQPFTFKTGQLILILLGFYFAFSRWQINLNPLINIFIKTCIIAITYLWTVYRFKISKDITEVLKKCFKLFFKT